MASTFTHLKIPLEEIQRATNNFADENIIGKGGFGSVYKGQITHRGEPTNIAARRLDRRHGQGDVEFWTEIDVLSSLVNESIVELIGYVDEKDEKIIVNRDCAKGSLVKYLSDPTGLTWSERLYISRHIADAINYIHHDLKQGYYIIHRNINSFTILLDDDWKPPRLSGFEFSIKHPVERQNQILLCDEAIGTKGYMDPADLKHGGVTHKSDVYSFGVVLFELLCGRKAKDQDNKLLASLAKFHYENGTLQDIIHPDLWNQMDPESFKCFSEAAYSCLEEDRAQRPNAEQVLDKLQKALDIREEVDEVTVGCGYMNSKQEWILSSQYLLQYLIESEIQDETPSIRSLGFQTSVHEMVFKPAINLGFLGFTFHLVVVVFTKSEIQDETPIDRDSWVFKCVIWLCGFEHQ